MKRKTLIPLTKIFLLTFLTLFFSCTKEPDKIGLSIQPEEDKLNVNLTDSLYVLAYSEIIDSIQTDEFSQNVLGSYVDPVFGKTTASIYTQIRLSDNDVDFGESPVLDSIVLNLAYNGYYGYTGDYQTINVYELSEGIDPDSTYYSNQSFAANTKVLASKTFVPAPEDSILADTNYVKPYLSIRLDDALGQRFLNMSGSTELSDNDFFTDYFKGFFIEALPVEAEGMLMYYDLEDDYSGLTIYYHTSEDTLDYEFVINEKCARFNHYDHHNYEHADPIFKEHLIYNDSLLGENLLYLQAMGGVRTKISFPTLMDLKKNHSVMINKAELFIYEPGISNELDPPTKLALARINEEGDNVFTLDQAEGDAYFGGYYEQSQRVYRFRITRHIQALLNGDFEDYGMALMVSGSAVQANRLIFNGINPQLPMLGSKKLKLQITYTLLN